MTPEGVKCVSMRESCWSQCLTPAGVIYHCMTPAGVKYVSMHDSCKGHVTQCMPPVGVMYLNA